MFHINANRSTFFKNNAMEKWPQLPKTSLTGQQYIWLTAAAREIVVPDTFLHRCLTKFFFWKINEVTSVFVGGINCKPMRKMTTLPGM